MAGLQENIFVEGDMVVFGYGGFYERPKGFGLDLCYFQKSFFRSPFRGKVKKKLLAKIQAEIATGQLLKGFVPQFVRRLRSRVEPEWHYDRAELLFQSMKPRYPALQRFEQFPQFISQILGAPFCTAPELEEKVVDYLRHIDPQSNPIEWVENQNFLLFGYVQKALKEELEALIGQVHGEWLYKQLLDAAPQDPRSAMSLDEFLSFLLLHEKALRIIAEWHRGYFSGLLHQIDTVMRSVRKVKVGRRNALAKQAATVTAKELKGVPIELQSLLKTLDVPFFIAISEDLRFFREFSQPGFLVLKRTGQLQQMVGLGLCVYRPNAKGAICVTYQPEHRARFVHTLLEETTHFADGPENRMALRGHHRYSGSAEFAQAYEADVARHANWQFNKVLTAREWGMILSLKRVKPRKIAKIREAVEAYQAEINFLHYPETERMAETFAVLPVIERAVGRTLSREILPELFKYYDRTYRLGLQSELRALGRQPV